jgi:hypothetical protein
MAPATLKIKKKLLENGDTIAGLAEQWGFTRTLLTKVIHCERGSGDVAISAQKRLARYMKTTVRELFGPEEQARAA